MFNKEIDECAHIEFGRMYIFRLKDFYFSKTRWGKRKYCAVVFENADNNEHIIREFIVGVKTNDKVTTKHSLSRIQHSKFRQLGIKNFSELESKIDTEYFIKFRKGQDNTYVIDSMMERS